MHLGAFLQASFVPNTSSSYVRLYVPVHLMEATISSHRLLCSLLPLLKIIQRITNIIYKQLNSFYINSI